MKKLSLLLPLLWACKTKQIECDSYLIYRVPYNDSIVVSQWHEHVNFDKKNHCIFVPKEITYFTDTLEIKIPIDVYYYKSNERVDPVDYTTKRK